MVKKEEAILLGACTASAVASILLRAPDLMALPLATIAANREKIYERLINSGKFTEHELKCFFREIDSLIERGERKLKEVV